MGFGDFLQLSVLQPDRPLLQALAERWDSRTNAFVLPISLLMINLKDVVRLISLRVSGLPVAGTMESGLRGLAATMLGESAPFQENTMLLGMFPSHFGWGVQTTHHQFDTAESYARRRRRMQGRQLATEPGPRGDMELRGFMFYMFGWTLFASASDRVSL